MYERTLSIYHHVTKALIIPDQEAKQSANFSLAIGTANNLYKLLPTTNGLQYDINNSIIIAWTSSIKQVLYAMNEILKRYWTEPDDGDEQPLEIKVKLYQNNDLGQKLIYLLEQYDLVIRIIFYHASNKLSQEQCAKWLIFFSDKLGDVLNFPYKSEQLITENILKKPSRRA